MKKFLTDINVNGGEQITENSVWDGYSNLTTISYYERVVNSGGFIEAIGCVANKYGDYGNIFANGSVYGELSLVTRGFVSSPLIKTQSIQSRGQFAVYVDGYESLRATSGGLLVPGTLTINGDTYVLSQNGRTMGFSGLATGQTVYFQYGGDSNNRISTTYGSGVMFDAYHGVTVRTSPASTGTALIVNNRNASQYTQDWQVSGVSKAYIDGSGQFYLAALTFNGPVKATGGVLSSVSGYNGSFTVVTNPPGQQTLSIQDGIIINVL
jgi:hypothetical protein